MPPDWFTQLPAPPDRPPVRLADLAWPEIAALPPEESVALIPIGAIEQHGPHLPIDTDLRIAEGVCLLASSLTGAPVLPGWAYGVSTGHTEKWPGTFSLRHQTFTDALCDLACWLQAIGWKRVLFVNGHCGNDACLRVAIDRIRTSTSLLAAVRNTWQLSPEIAAAFSADATDWHANCAETSVMLILAPHTVHLERLTAADDPDRTGGLVFPHRVAHTSTNGVTGQPSAATAAQGRELLQNMGHALASLIRQAHAETPPLPWSAPHPFPCC